MTFLTRRKTFALLAVTAIVVGGWVFLTERPMSVSVVVAEDANPGAGLRSWHGRGASGLEDRLRGRRGTDRTSG